MRDDAARVVHKVLPHTKRIDIVYLHMVHGMSISQIQKTFKLHYTTVDRVLWEYKELGRTSKPHNTNCPVSKKDLIQKEIEILDAKEFEAALAEKDYQMIFDNSMRAMIDQSQSMFENGQSIENPSIKCSNILLHQNKVPQNKIKE